METGWRINSFSGGDDTGVLHNTNNNIAWDICNNNTPHWIHPASVREQPQASVVHALLFNNTTTGFPDAGVGWNSEPHMMCLKLGKRHYCEDDAGSSSAITKRGHNYNPCYVTRVTANSTRCQVEGCHVALVNAKEYYRRHKVCEIHSKAPKVVVSGLQQRFCQQCSRFHDVREFDEAKRSCRRRLEGHNLRRRKGALSNSLPRNFPHFQENNSTMEQRLGALSTSQSSSSQSRPVCALSLLSSTKTEPWIPSGDLSSRCSAALYELIAANRAFSVSGHFLNQNSSHQTTSDTTMRTSQDINRFNDHTTMTLDVKQAPALDFGLLAMKDESKDQEEWSDYCWSAFGGTNMM